VIDFANLAPGHVIADRYVLEARIGQGRSSAVYRAHDPETRTRVALKILDPFVAQDAAGVERFRREVQIVRALDHPNVIKVFDLLRDQDLHVICMEWVDGVDAKALLHRDGPLPVERFLPLARRVLSAVEACHRAGVLHRDIKPQNLLVDRRGRPRLVDFGISKMHGMSDLTRTGTAIGTPEYMAPELFRSECADPRSDIYALGAVFYELLTGRPPYSGTSLASIMTQQLEREVEPLSSHRDVPVWLDAVVLRCLRLDPDRRYQSPAEVDTELRRRERALAVYGERNRPAPCRACGTEMVPGLIFCHDCGKFTHEVFEPGSFHVILYRSDEPRLLREHLTRFFPGLAGWRTWLRLQLRPVVLFSGLSEGAANSLYNELAASFSELGVSDRLSREMRLPPWMTALALVSMPVFLFAFYFALAALGHGDIRGGLPLAGLLLASPAASLGALFGLYRWKIRPLVSWRQVRRRAQRRPAATALRMVELLREIHGPSTRRLLGAMAANFFAIEGLAGERDGAAPPALEPLLMAAFRAARRLDLYALHLSGRSPARIREELARTAARVRGCDDPAPLEDLIVQRSELEQELADTRETQELYSRTHLTILAAAGTLERLRSAIQSREPCGRSLAQLEALGTELAADPCEPAEPALNP
jgi:hypothetical protein